MPWAPVVQDDILLRQVFFYLQSFFLCNQSLFSLCHFSSCPFHLCVPVSCCKMLPLGIWNPDEIFRFVNNELFFNGAVNLVVDNRIVLTGWRSDPYYFIMNLVGRRGCYLLRINICVKRARRGANGKNSIRLIPQMNFTYQLGCDQKFQRHTHVSGPSGFIEKVSVAMYNIWIINADYAGHSSYGRSLS